MRKLLPILVVAFLGIPTVVFAGQNKVVICHLPPGNPSNGQTISIPLAQWEGPGGHSPGGHGGDYAGECQNQAVIPTPTTTESPTPTGEPEPTPTDVPEPTPTDIEPTLSPTDTPEPTPTIAPEETPTPEPTPTNTAAATFEEEVQSTIDQIIALLEQLLDFIQDL